MAVPAIKPFLDLLFGSPELLEEVKHFACKQNCFQCGLCVGLADRNDISISTAEMDAARQLFIAGELVVEGVRYAPNPDRVAALQRARAQRLSLAKLAPPPLSFERRPYL
jgi:hypothetical protein